VGEPERQDVHLLIRQPPAQPESVQDDQNGDDDEGGPGDARDAR